MTSLVFVTGILFGLRFVSYQCEGIITTVDGRDKRYATPGEDVTIEWKFHQDPANLYSRTWRLNTKKGGVVLAIIFRDEAVSRVHRNVQFEVIKPATLILKNVNDSYNGTYTFEIKPNAGATEMSSVTFSIAAKPSVTVNCSSPTIVDEDSNVRCLCKGEGGNPPANATWYKDGVQIDFGGDEEKMLTLLNVTGENNGTYKCVAESYTLKAEKSIEVKIRPNFAPVMTSLTFKPEKMILGQPVTIICETSARPLPTYIIFHNCAEVLNGTKSTYTIQEVKDSDAGLFKCIAKNKVGTSQSKHYVMTFHEEKSDRGTKWYIVFVSLLSGIVIGLIFSYVFVYFRRRVGNEKPQPNPEPQISTVNSAYQDLDLTKMNSEDDYQSLRVNSGRNDAGKKIRKSK